MEKLLKEAIEASKKAYAPYSHFCVGAAALMDDDTIIAGCNVENASYGLSICAERNTLFQTVAKGYSKENIKAFLVVGNTLEPISPCGACRQVMSELLNPDCKVYLTNLNGNVLETSVKDLLPYSFKELK